MLHLKDLAHDDDTFEGTSRARLALLAALFAIVSVLALIDLITDFKEGVSASHWALEGVLLGAGIVGLVAMIRALLRVSVRAKSLEVQTRSLSDRLRAKAAEADSLSDELLETAAEAEQWRAEARELMQGLGAAIDRQFDKWDLTEAEREVALLLLKGLSHKEVAAVRDTTDSTTRQQARAVYKKAGLSGRNDLAAFFLEDLLLPTRDLKGS